MKQILLFLFGLFFSFSINAQISDTYSTSTLIDGCPKGIEYIKDQMNLSGMSYAFLYTGLDSLQVMFGEFSQSGRKAYWISLFNNDKLLVWTTVQLMLDNETGLFTNTLDVKYDNSSKMFSAKILHNTSTHEIQYLWIADNKMSKTALIKNIDKPIQKGKLFPPLKVETLNGDTISIKDLIGKYVVINWWATTCGPCRVEISGLNFIVDKYKNDANIVFLAIAFDKKGALENFLRIKEFKYLQTLGDEETSKLFGESFPKHLIINREGFISYYQEGGSEDQYLKIDEELKKVLKD